MIWAALSGAALSRAAIQLARHHRFDQPLEMPLGALRPIDSGESAPSMAQSPSSQLSHPSPVAVCSSSVNNSGPAPLPPTHSYNRQPTAPQSDISRATVTGTTAPPSPRPARKVSSPPSPPNSEHERHGSKCPQQHLRPLPVPSESVASHRNHRRTADGGQSSTTEDNYPAAATTDQ